MRVAIDGAGRLVIPKALREAVGVDAATELEISAVDGRLEITVPDLDVEIARGADGLAVLRDVGGQARPMSVDGVRSVLEQTRR